jgi:hypothetical protein
MCDLHHGVQQKILELCSVAPQSYLPTLSLQSCNLRSAFSQPLFLLLAQRFELLCKSMCCRRPLEEVYQEPLCLIISLSSTARLFIRKCHELFFAEAAAQVDKWVRLVFPVAIL